MTQLLDSTTLFADASKLSSKLPQQIMYTSVPAPPDSTTPSRKRKIEEPIYGKELDAVLTAVLETDDPVSNVKKARQVFSTGDAKSDYNTAINTVPNYKSLPLKERNRLSAERSRKRKLQKMDNLLQENMQLKEIVNQLKLENEQLLAQQQQNVEELDGDDSSDVDEVLAPFQKPGELET